MLYLHIFQRSSGGSLGKNVNVESVRTFRAGRAITRLCDGILGDIVNLGKGV